MNAPLLLPHAQLSVDFFFLLSGFVVANAYEKKLLHSMTFARFVTIRLARLYPMILVGGLLGAIVLLARLLTTHSLTYSQLLIESLSGIILLPTTMISRLYPHNEALFPINPSLWSLFFELIINFIYAMIVCELNTRRVWIICILSSTALAGVALLNDNINVGSESISFFSGFVRVTCPFFIGVLLSRYKPVFRVSNNTGIILLAFLAVILLNPFQTEEWVYDVLAIIVVFPIIVFVGVASRSNAIMSKSCALLGDLSYPLYVIHHPVLRIVLNGSHTLHLNMSNWITAVLCGVASILSAAMLLLLWDRPVRKYLMTSIDT
jgi:peptidoglycan/LPS O-acetylase OafA/YrhL